MDWKYGHVLLWPAISGVLGLVFFSGALKMAPAELGVPIINLTGLGVWIMELGIVAGLCSTTHGHGRALVHADPGGGAPADPDMVQNFDSSSRRGCYRVSLGCQWIPLTLAEL